MKGARKKGEKGGRKEKEGGEKKEPEKEAAMQGASPRFCSWDQGKRRKKKGTLLSSHLITASDRRRKGKKGERKRRERGGEGKGKEKDLPYIYFPLDGLEQNKRGGEKKEKGGGKGGKGGRHRGNKEHSLNTNTLFLINIYIYAICLGRPGPFRN